MWPESFSRRRLYQIVGFREVDSVSPVYLGEALWRNPVDTGRRRFIFVVGFDPSESVFELPDIRLMSRELVMPDVVLFDRDSRTEFGPIPEMLEEGEVVTEIDNRRVRVIGSYRLGTSFGIDGSIVTSDLNFLRLFPERPQALIDLGLIRLSSAADPERARHAIAASIPNDVEILDRNEFIAKEIDFWNTTTPIGYFFTFGTIMGIVVGATFVYQILFADVSEHVRDFATLKAVGYGNGYLSFVVLQQAMWLAAAGYAPGFAIAAALYETASDATKLPVEMSVWRALFVLALTVSMCSVSGVVALRKVRLADPAESF